MSQGEVAPEAGWFARHRAQLGAYAGVVLATVLFSAILIKPWIATDGIFTSGNDYWWIQSSAQVAAQSGPFAVDPHLGWSVGYSLWSVPQLGIWIGVMLWLLGGILGFSSAAAVLWVAVASAALNAAACLFFFRSALPTVRPALAGSFSIALGAAPAVLFMPAHLNVGAWFLVPFAFGLLFRLNRRLSTRRTITWLVALAVVMVIAPLWWVVVVLLLISAALVPALLLRQWRALAYRIVIVVAAAVAFGIQVLISSTVPNSSDVLSRSPWDSNAFGGHLVDFVLSSPLVDRYLPPMQLLITGASKELKPIGLIAGLAAVFLVFVLLAGTGLRRLFPSLRDDDRDLMSQLSIIVLLFFVVGGLGNLQAAVGVLAGPGSPARAWSRLGLVVALMGCAWLLVALRRWAVAEELNKPDEPDASQAPNRRAATFGVWLLAAVVLVAWFVDSAATGTIKFRIMGDGPRVAAPSTFAEYDAVNFISRSRQPCPVLQLPVTNGLVPRTKKESEELSELYYRGYVPFLINPDYYWTYGSVAVSDLEDISRTATQIAAGDSQAQARYCAVLFDKAVAPLRDRSGQPLQGSDPSKLGTPAFTSERFDVYLLSDTATGAG